MPVRIARVCVPALAALAGGGVIVGCGSASPGDASAAHVRSTVRRALADLAQARGDDFCALATPDAQRSVAAAATGYSCSRLIDALGSRLPAARRTALLHARVGTVTVRGRTATVRIADIGTSQGSLQGFLGSDEPPARLAEQPDGSWKIAG